MFRVFIAPIIRNTWNCNCSLWYRSYYMNNNLPPAWPKATLHSIWTTTFFQRGLWPRWRKFLPHTLHVCGRNLITGLTSAASPRVDISNTCKVRQKFGVSLPLLTCSLSAWPSRLLYRRGRKSRRDLWISLYFVFYNRYNLHVNIFWLRDIYIWTRI